MSFRNLSILSGLIFLATLIYYARKLTSSKFSFYSFIFLNLLGAVTILFYGYVETYSITTAVLYLFFLSSLSSLKNGTRSPVPLFILFFAIFLHRISIVYVPALIIYLILVYGGDRIKTFILTKAGILLAALFSAIILLYLAIELMGSLLWKRIFLSPLGDRYTMDGYYLFSAPHILDYINLLVFLAPISLFLIILRRRRIAPPPGIKSGTLLFLGTAVVSGLTFAFLLEPKLGMARDWDLMSTMFTGIIMAGTFLWVEKYSRTPGYLASTILLIILEVSIFFPWIALHKSGNLYFYNMDMMELDPRHCWSGFYTMAGANRRFNLPQESERIMRYCERQFPESEISHQGFKLWKAGKYREAVIQYNRAIELNPSFHPAYVARARCQIALKEPTSALQDLKIAEALNPNNSDIFYYRGEAYNLMHNEKSAVENWKKSLKFDSQNYKSFLSLARYYNLNSMTDSSMQWFLRVPDSLMTNDDKCLIGKYKMQAGDSIGAAKYLRMCDSIGANSNSESKTAPGLPESGSSGGF